MPDRARFWSPVPDWWQATLEGPALRIEVLRHVALWVVSGNTAAFLQRHALTGTLGPREPAVEVSYALRLAPDRLLFVSDEARECEFGWTAEGCAISDISDGLVCIELAGEGARELLGRGTEYAFENAAQLPHESAQMLFAGIRVIVARGTGCWRLFVERPWAAALWRWLEMNLE